MGSPDARPAVAASRRLSLTLYVLPDCAPCRVIKAALADPAFAAYEPIGIHAFAIDEVRALRKQIGRLSFPILVAKDGEAILSRRLGASVADPESERDAILGWLDEIARPDRAGRTDPS